MREIKFNPNVWPLEDRSVRTEVNQSLWFYEAQIPWLLDYLNGDCKLKNIFWKTIKNLDVNQHLPKGAICPALLIC